MYRSIQDLLAELDRKEQELSNIDPNDPNYDDIYESFNTEIIILRQAINTPIFHRS